MLALFAGHLSQGEYGAKRCCRPKKEVVLDDVGFFDAFMPHGMCYLWYPNILLMHVVSDALIAIAYFCIPLALYYFFRSKTDFPFRNVILMFSVFIFTCGLSHVMGIWTVWHGTYGLQGLIKAATALASILTAAMLVPLMPQLMALRSPRELEAVNSALVNEINERVRSETRAQRFVEAAPDAVIIVDPNLVIQVANVRAETVFGIERDRLIGQPIDMIIPDRVGASLSSYVSAFAALLTNHDTEQGRPFFGLRADQSVFPIEVSVSEVGSQEQELFSLAIRDVTERRELEMQTQRLEQQIAHVDRLDTMGQMAAGLAHEINQPLMALSQNADSALAVTQSEEKVNPLLLEILHDIEDQAQRAGDIIRALRQYVGNDKSAHAAFDLDELLQQTMRLVDSDTKLHAVDIQLELDEPKTVFGDRVQVAQVFLNLLKNSIEAMVEADVTERLIKVTSKHETDATRITVVDTGPGLEPNKNVFVPFQSEKGDGLGVGLSICRSIIESHGGKFFIDSDVTRGAKFTFTLPHEKEPQ